MQWFTNVIYIYNKTMHDNVNVSDVLRSSGCSVVCGACVCVFPARGGEHMGQSLAWRACYLCVSLGVTACVCNLGFPW